MGKKRSVNDDDDEPGSAEIGGGEHEEEKKALRQWVAEHGKIPKNKLAFHKATHNQCVEHGWLSLRKTMQLASREAEIAAKSNPKKNGVPAVARANPHDDDDDDDDGSLLDSESFDPLFIVLCRLN